MTRILFTLASLALILMVTALVIGLSIGDLYDKPSADTLHWATIHRLTGVAAALAVVFVESIVVTYFIGTSRWCKEVVETYKMNPITVAESNQLKRRAFAWSVTGMLTIVGVIALGAAADPATGRANTEAWTTFHLLGAIAGTILIAWTFFSAWQYVWANQSIIGRITAEVARIRRQRGLDSASLDQRPLTKGSADPTKSV